jgi:hypothetical protein
MYRKIISSMEPYLKETITSTVSYSSDLFIIHTHSLYYRLYTQYQLERQQKQSILLSWTRHKTWGKKIRFCFWQQTRSNDSKSEVPCNQKNVHSIAEAIPFEAVWLQWLLTSDNLKLRFFGSYQQTKEDQLYRKSSHQYPSWWKYMDTMWKY